MRRPSLCGCIDALRFTHPAYPHICPSDEESDVAAVLESVDAAHQGDGDEEDRMGCWGVCRRCETPWPCESWRWAQMLAVQFLGRAADRVFASAPGPDELPRQEYLAGVVSLPRRARTHRGLDEAELMRLRYPPDGDVGRWVREGPPGHVNYPGKTASEESA